MNVEPIAALETGAPPELSWWREWLGPLGRYRPGILRRDMAEGFRNCEHFYLPGWARLPLLASGEERLLRRFDFTGQVVYDVGAHIGAYTLFFSRQVGPSGSVVAFEPQPRSFARLARNLERNGIANVRAERVALGCAAGQGNLYMLAGMRTTASLVAARGPLRRPAGVCRVECLDNIARRLRLPGPDFIKIDVEGAECEVLRGSVETLRRWRPSLLVEIHGRNPAEGVARARNLAAWLQAFGYRIGPTAGRGEHLFALRPNDSELPAA